MAAISDVTEGTLIAFSNASGKVTADPKGKGYPFAEYLTTVPGSRPSDGLELVNVLRRAGRAVKQEMGQVSWMSQDLSIDDYVPMAWDCPPQVMSMLVALR